MTPCVVACTLGVGECIVHARRAGGIHRLRQPEVEHLHCAVVAHLDVGGLQIAVDDVLLMRRFERVRDLLRDRQRLVDRDRAARDSRRQVVALDQFHDQGGEVWGLLEAVDRPDVRMVEGRERFGFTLKARKAIRIAGHRCRQHLDRRRPLQIAVDRAIDLAHSAFAELGDDGIRPDCLADHHRPASASARPRRSSPSKSKRAEAGPPAPICVVTS
jgi:hypothetical protein